MPRHRLFVRQPIARNQYLAIEGDPAHYLNRVLRMRVGDELTIFEGDGLEYPAEISEIGKNKAVLHAGEPHPRDVESPLPIRLAQGVSRGERMDLVVQKATELGVHSIVPLITEFTVVRLKSGRGEKRLEHWRRVVQSACEQCGRNRLPKVAEPQPFSDYLQDASTADRRLLLHPNTDTTIADLAGSADSVDLLIGPEGGLSDAEKEAAVATGFTPVALGPRILRTETAALAAVALVQARWGDLQA